METQYVHCIIDPRSEDPLDRTGEGCEGAESVVSPSVRSRIGYVPERVCVCVCVSVAFLCT